MIKIKGTPRTSDDFWTGPRSEMPSESNGILEKECARACKSHNVSCPVSECRNWMDYEEDHNCAVIAAFDHDKLTLREVAERLKLSFVRVKQIEDTALVKLKKRLEKFELGQDYL